MSGIQENGRLGNPRNAHEWENKEFIEWVIAEWDTRKNEAKSQESKRLDNESRRSAAKRDLEVVFPFYEWRRSLVVKETEFKRLLEWLESITQRVHLHLLVCLCENVLDERVCLFRISFRDFSWMNLSPEGEGETTRVWVKKETRREYPLPRKVFFTNKKDMNKRLFIGTLHASSCLRSQGEKEKHTKLFLNYDRMKYKLRFFRCLTCSIVGTSLSFALMLTCKLTWLFFRILWMKIWKALHVCRLDVNESRFPLHPFSITCGHVT